MSLPMSFRISGLAEIMECEGSASLVSPEFPPHPAAAEGTAAGEYLRHLIEKTTPGTHATNGVPFDDDMKFFAVDTLPKISPNAKCEHEISYQTRSGIWLIGHPDASSVSNTDLIIEDYKYGWNIVDVVSKRKDGSIKPNWQLLGYGAAEMRRLNPSVTHITFKIHQPRPHHEEGSTRIWRIPLHEFWAYVEQIEVRMDSIKRGGVELVTGKQCKYCPHTSGSCPAFRRLFNHSMEIALWYYKKDQMSTNEIAMNLEHINRASEVLEIQKKSLHQLAIQRIHAGEIVPGWITEKSFGDRKWKPFVSPASISAMTKGINITETVMMSPAKAEKVGVPKDLVATLVDRHYIGQKLVQKDASEVGAVIFNKQLIGGMPYGS